MFIPNARALVEKIDHSAAVLEPALERRKILATLANAIRARGTV